MEVPIITSEQGKLWAQAAFHAKRSRLLEGRVAELEAQLAEFDQLLDLHPDALVPELKARLLKLTSQVKFRRRHQRTKGGSLLTHAQTDLMEVLREGKQSLAAASMLLHGSETALHVSATRRVADALLKKGLISVADPEGMYMITKLKRGESDE